MDFIIFEQDKNGDTLFDAELSTFIQVKQVNY